VTIVKFEYNIIVWLGGGVVVRVSDFLSKGHSFDPRVVRKSILDIYPVFTIYLPNIYHY